MTNVACFCGCSYSFDGVEAPCPRCGAVAGVHAAAVRQAGHDRGPSNQPTMATAAPSSPALLALALGLGLGSAQPTS